ATTRSNLTNARTCLVSTHSLSSPLVSRSRKCSSRSSSSSAAAAAAVVGARAAMNAAEIAQALSDKRVQPRGERLLVKLDEPEQKSAGGVLLPTQAVKYERYLTGQVVSTGEEVKKASAGQKVSQTRPCLQPLPCSSLTHRPHSPPWRLPCSPP
ncbi:unnamed protein product, partial [Closterium sp. NIES-53]